jgi:hypothetical protein
MSTCTTAKNIAFYFQGPKIGSWSHGSVISRRCDKRSSKSLIRNGSSLVFCGMAWCCWLVSKDLKSAGGDCAWHIRRFRLSKWKVFLFFPETWCDCKRRISMASCDDGYYFFVASGSVSRRQTVDGGFWIFRPSFGLKKRQTLNKCSTHCSCQVYPIGWVWGKFHHTKMSRKCSLW